MTKPVRVAILSVNPGVTASIIESCGALADCQVFSEPGTLSQILQGGAAFDLAFVPHWRWKVPAPILAAVPCIGFHASPLPKGRGGSPIQNQIALGNYDSEVCALLLVEDWDAGPVLLRKNLDLSCGSLEQINAQIASIVGEMSATILTQQLTPQPQTGHATYYSRRHPRQSAIDLRESSQRQVYDHIRMLDGMDYPRAYLDAGSWRLTFSSASLEDDEVVAQVRFTRRQGGE